MRYSLLLLLIAPILLFAQQKNEYAKDALMIIRIASKAHVQPKPFDDQFGEIFYNRFLAAVDPEKILLNQMDLQLFAPFKKTIRTDILGQKTDFLSASTILINTRIKQIDSLLGVCLTKQFSFETDEYLTAKEDST